MGECFGELLVLDKVELVILDLEHSSVKQHEHDAGDEHGGADRVALPVIRAPLFGPDVASRDVAELRKRVDERQGDDFLVLGRGDGGGDPAEDAGVAGVRRSLDEEREEARSKTGGGGSDDESDYAEDERSDDVQRSFLHAIRVKTIGETSEERKEPDGSSEKERDRLRIAKRADDGGEELVETYADCDGSEHESQNPDLDVLDSHQETLHRRSLFVVG